MRKLLGIAFAACLFAAPTAFSVKAEEYPLGQRLFLYTNGESADAVKLARLILEARNTNGERLTCNFSTLSKSA